MIGLEFYCMELLTGLLIQQMVHYESLWFWMVAKK